MARIQFGPKENKPINLSLTPNAPKANGVEISDGRNRVRVTCEDEGIWRMTFFPSGEDRRIPTFGLLSKQPGRAARVSETADGWRVDADGKMSASIRRSTGEIEFIDRDGGRILATHPHHRMSFNPGSGAVSAYFAREADDVYFGLGEKSGTLVKNGRIFRFGACDAAGYESEFHDPLYKNIPFLLIGNKSRRRFGGVFFCTGWEGYINLGATIDNYFGGDFHVEFEGGPMDIYIFSGTTPASVIERYTRLTGRTVLQPKFTLGYLASAFWPSEQPNAADLIVGFAKKCRELGIPCDGWHLSSGYTTDPSGSKRRVFQWNAKRFPDVEEFCRKSRDLGVRIAANVKPALLIDHPNYAEAADAGYFIRNADGTGPLVTRFWGGDASFIDFTNSGARRWWIDKLKSTLLDRGVEGIWNDNCEFSIYDSDAICEGDGERYPIGGLKTIQTNLMNRTAHEAARERDPNRRPWVVSRAGWAGIQQFAQTWSGDNTSSWHELKWNIPVGLGMGLSGVANESHDVGGFCGPKPEPELLVRWCQAGIFMPRFTIHSSGKDMTEPWSYPDMAPHVRESIRFRYRLIPLIYSLLDEARRTGAPIQRPMVWHFPDDLTMWDQNFQFLFGEHLLTAPVTESGARMWPVRLPAGHDWLDWFTGKRLDGGQTAVINAPMDQFVLLLRDGAIVPMQKIVSHIGTETIENLELHLALPRGLPSTFTLYDDDGETNQHLTGNFHRRGVELNREDKRVCRLTFRAPEGLFAPTWRTLSLHFMEPVARVRTAGGADSPIQSSDGRTIARARYQSGPMEFLIETP